MNVKEELIKQQLDAFSGWLGCNIRIFNHMADAAANVGDNDKFMQALALRDRFKEVKKLFEMVRENVEDLMDGGDDDERCGIDPYYM